MIISNLKECERVCEHFPFIQYILEFTKSFDIESATVGMFELKGKDFFYIYSESNNEFSEVNFECHKRYIDVHLVLKGEEEFAWAPLSLMKRPIRTYSEEDDVSLYSDLVRNKFTLHPDDFVIFFPEDCHAPSISSKELKKLVFKIKIEE